MAAKTSIRNVELYEDAFLIAGRRHSISDVRHLRLFRRLLSTHIAVPTEFTKLGQEEHVGLLVTLKSGEEYQFTEQPGWIKSADQRAVKQILDFYSYLARASLTERVEAYLENFRSYGYFYYSGLRFFPDHQTIVDGSTTYNRQNTDFLHSYGCIELRPKELSFIQQAKLKVGSANFTRIDTLTDTDALYVILSEFYGLRWK